jgi:hypothetical protein
VPEAARRLGSSFRFLIVGDGGTRKKLEERISKLGVKNVALLPPVGRKQLIKYYKQADILFLHLNDVPAFKRVLPSKIFEYAALCKPIAAGLSGYSAQFMTANVSHSRLFNPGCVDGCVKCIRDVANISVDLKLVESFIEKYSRERIMFSLVDHILLLVSNKTESV